MAHDERTPIDADLSIRNKGWGVMGRHRTARCTHRSNSSEDNVRAMSTLRGCSVSSHLKIQARNNSGGAMALLHPHRSDRYEAKRTYTSDACGGLRLRASSGFDWLS
ncbi:hypothetical protein [Nostoc sp.]